MANKAIAAVDKKHMRNTDRRARMRFVILGLSPIILYFLIFSVYPIIYAMYISFHEWGLMDKVHPFVGFQNYVSIFQDEVFIICIKNTLWFAVLNVTLGTCLGLLTAVFVNSLPKCMIGAMRGIMFMPVVTSMIAVSFVFQLLYDPARGLINYLLGFLGIGPFMFLSSPDQALASIMVTTVWKNLGYNMVLFIAGLTSIPHNLYEAAEMDGANKWWQFWKITIPLLKSTTLFVVVTAIINSFQAFTQIYNMTEGGPGTASRTIVMHVYETAFRFFSMGKATAMAFVLFGMILVITFIQLRCFHSDSAY